MMDIPSSNQVTILGVNNLSTCSVCLANEIVLVRIKKEESGNPILTLFFPYYPLELFLFKSFQVWPIDEYVDFAGFDIPGDGYARILCSIQYQG